MPPPLQELPVYIGSELARASDTATSQSHALGICLLLNLNQNSQADFAPVIEANTRPALLGGRISGKDTKFWIALNPKGGAVEPNPDWINVSYFPHAGFTGEDSFIIGIQRGTATLQLHYFITVTEDNGEYGGKNCKAAIWQIVST